MRELLSCICCVAGMFVFGLFFWLVEFVGRIRRGGNE